jgi:hypothetical protein
VLDEGAVGEPVDPLPELSVVHDVWGCDLEDLGDVVVVEWTIAERRASYRPDAAGAGESASSRVGEGMQERLGLRFIGGQALNGASEDSSVFPTEQLGQAIYRSSPIWVGDDLVDGESGEEEGLVVAGDQFGDAGGGHTQAPDIGLLESPGDVTTDRVGVALQSQGVFGWGIQSVEHVTIWCRRCVGVLMQRLSGADQDADVRNQSELAQKGGDGHRVAGLV